ncbi:MAG: hypothetical protein WBL95_13210 [Microcoleus sp.]
MDSRGGNFGDRTFVRFPLLLAICSPILHQRFQLVIAEGSSATDYVTDVTDGWNTEVGRKKEEYRCENAILVFVLVMDNVLAVEQVAIYN